MNQSLDVSTIVFAALAIFIVWKLRSVLGTRTGEERPPFNPFQRRGAQPAERGESRPDAGQVIPLPGSVEQGRPSSKEEPWKGLADAGSPVAQGLSRIAAADASFDGPRFLDGAKSAYELILGAFAKGDHGLLSGLLARDVYDGFNAAISDREKRRETLDHTMVSLDPPVIEEALLVDGTAQITLRFESNQINTLRTADKQVAPGSSEAVTPVVDRWTFTRAVTARDPNWTLSATTDA